MASGSSAPAGPERSFIKNGRRASMGRPRGNHVGVTPASPPRWGQVGDDVSYLPGCYLGVGGFGWCVYEDITYKLGEVGGIYCLSFVPKVSLCEAAAGDAPQAAPPAAAAVGI